MRKMRINKRLAAGMLVVLALLTLFLDFSALTDAAQARMGLLSDPSGTVNAIDSMLGVNLYAMNKGDPSAYRLFTRIARILNDSGVSILEARTLLSTGNRLLDRQGEGSTGLTVVLVLLTLFIAVTFLSGIYALVGIYRHRRLRGFWLAGMLLALLFIEGMLVSAVNANSYFSLAVLTPWPFIGFAMAVGSICFCRAEDSSPEWDPVHGRGTPSSDRFSTVSRTGWSPRTGIGTRDIQADANDPVEAPGESWDCPRCGTVSEPGARFCSACGAARPRRRYCTQCGNPCRDDALYCSWCGVRLEDGPPDVDLSRVRPVHPFQGSVDRVTNGTQSEGLPSGTSPVTPEKRSAPVVLTVEALENRSGVNQTYQINLDKSVIIGRSPSCDLQIHDRTVSGSHLRIDREDDALYVTDLNSCNGTRLNGMLLTERAALKTEDRLAIGLTMLRVRWSGATA